MFIVVLFIFIGIAVGYLLRKSKRERLYEAVTKGLPPVTTWLIWLLLFLLGIEVGSNEQVIASLPTLGMEALVIASCAILGSCSLSFLLWKVIERRSNER